MIKTTAFRVAQAERRPLTSFFRATTAVVSATAILGGISSLLLIWRWMGADHEVLFDLQSGGSVNPVGALLGLIHTAAAVVWLAWQYRATSNLVAEGVDLRFTPAWAVLWWFIPVANLWMPALVMTDLVRGSARRAGRDRPPSVVVWAWWVAYALGSLAQAIGFVLVAFAVGLTQAGTGPVFVSAGGSIVIARVGSTVAAVGLVLIIVAAPLAIALLRMVTRWQETEPRLPPTPPRPDL